MARFQDWGWSIICQRPCFRVGSFGVCRYLALFFFDDNTFVLRSGDPLGERLARVAQVTGMLLMLCDQCAHERGLATESEGGYVPAGVVDGVQVGCFPDLYAALASNPPDHVITL